MNLKHAHNLCSHHSTLVRSSQRCGCFHCLETFSPLQIKEWIDKGETALCPHCHVDCVLPESSHYALSAAFLSRMQQHWLGELFG